MRIRPEQLHTYSTSLLPDGDRIGQILAAGLNAVDPFEAVRHHLILNGNTLTVGSQSYSIKNYRKVFLIGAGKAAVPMSAAAISILGGLITSGIVITKRGYLHSEYSLPPNIHIFEGSHPLPDQVGIDGTQQILHLLANAQANDLVICLISGGGSALLTMPQAGITLQEVQTLTTQLLACGATIDEINTIRKHIDIVKGGGLVSRAGSTHWITLILSDVIGDPLDRIASGPTAPDPSTYAESLKVLKKYSLVENSPKSIIAHLNHGMESADFETPKPGNHIFDQIQNLIVGNNALAAEAALHEAENLGFHTLLLTTSLQGEASQAGSFLAAIAHEINRSNQPIARPACLVAGGETTVTLHGSGSGGRNQELVLGAVTQIAGLGNIMVVSLATDGGDGPTDAAGAVANGITLERALSIQRNPSDYLSQNDSYHFFDSLGDLLKPGPTLTNVGDLSFVFAF